MLKNRKIFIFLLFFSLSGGGFLSGEVFRYHYEEGLEYRIKALINQKVFSNDRLIGNRMLSNDISVKVLSLRGGKATLENRFNLSERAEGKTKSNAVLLDSSSLIFDQDERGRQSGIPAGTYQPSVRDVPVFPEHSVSPGDQWTFPGKEIHDMKPHTGIPLRLVIPFKAHYRYVGKEPLPKVLNFPPGKASSEKKARINIGYTIDYKLSAKDIRLLKKKTKRYPVRIRGMFKQSLYWDTEKNLPAAGLERFRVRYEFNKGEAFSYKGGSRNVVTKVISPPARVAQNTKPPAPASPPRKPEKKPQPKKKPEKKQEKKARPEVPRSAPPVPPSPEPRKREQTALRDQTRPPAGETGEKSGVPQNLELKGRVYFSGNSFVLNPKALREIKSIIKDIPPGKTFFLKGYTARFGSEKVNKLLSLARARLAAGPIREYADAKKIYLKAEGSAGDENLVSGQAGNRRVDIYTVREEEKKE